jgi:hypothetical protein
MEAQRRAQAHWSVLPKGTMTGKKMPDNSLAFVLTIRPKTLTLDDIGRALSVAEAILGRRGETLHDKVRRKRDVWMLRTEMKSGIGADAGWRDFSSRLSEKKETLRRLAKTEVLELSLIVKAETEFPVVELSASTLRSISSLGLGLSVDIVGDLERGDYQWVARKTRSPH